MAGPASAPFVHFRETTLDYHGPSEDLTNLSEIRIGWFGPTNLDDALTGDLWWTVNFAIREANVARMMPAERGVRAASLSECPDASAPSSVRSAPAPAPPEGHAPAAAEDSSFHRLPFRLIARWAVDPWGTGVSQLTRMVYDEQPLALLGSVDSGSTHLAEQIVAKANLPLVSPVTTDKSVTLAGVSWMFSCAPSDAAIARVLVEDVFALLNETAARGAVSAERRRAGEETQGQRRSFEMPPRLALLACTDHESRMTTREVLKECARRGRAPASRFDVPSGAHDLVLQLAALGASCPDAVMIVAGAEDSARLTKAVRERLSAIPIFGGHSMARARFRELAGSAAEGVRFPLLFVPNFSESKAAGFVARFMAERLRPPDYTAALTYDATCLLLEGIRRGGPNRARIREALTQLTPWPGIAGLIHFDGTGQNTRTNLCMAFIRNGVVLPMKNQSALTQTARTSNPL